VIDEFLDQLDAIRPEVDYDFEEEDLDFPPDSKLLEVTCGEAECHVKVTPDLYVVTTRIGTEPYETSSPEDAAVAAAALLNKQLHQATATLDPLADRV
jgi:hypothetical protein